LKLSPFECPGKINSIPTPVPKQLCFLSSFFTSAVGGIVVFASIYVQVYFIWHALWTNMSYYYLFGLLLAVSIAMCLIAGEIPMFAVHLSLCYEDYRWWWIAFRIPTSVSIVFFGYSIYFILRIYRPPDWSSIAVYLFFPSAVAIALAYVNGSIGFLCAFVFVQKIFGVLKME
jgi:transmembrane 9 superfamily protein 2/4